VLDLPRKIGSHHVDFSHRRQRQDRKEADANPRQESK